MMTIKKRPDSKTSRERPRPGTVTVELNEYERAKLERLRDKKNLDSGLRHNISSTIRELIRQAPE